MTHITRLLLIWRLIYNIEMHRVIDNMNILRIFSFTILMGTFLSADINIGKDKPKKDVALEFVIDRISGNFTVSSDDVRIAFENLEIRTLFIAISD